jgi:hypothetical protein
MVKNKYVQGEYYVGFPQLSPKIVGVARTSVMDPDPQGSGTFAGSGPISENECKH